MATMMNSTTFLSEDEIVELTKKRRKSSQAVALRFMGIEHRIRPDGSLAILRTHIEQTLGVIATERSRKPEPGPNWSVFQIHRHAKTA